MKLLITIVLLFSSFSFSQVCFNELRQGFSDEQLAEQITNIEAAFLVKRAVDLLEPNLPPLGPIPYDFDLPADSENYNLIRFLIERNLLNSQNDIDQDGLELRLVNSLRSWYDLPPLDFSDDITVIEFISILSNTMNLLELNPVALVASGVQRTDIGFWSIIRNDSIYPRMIVMRPPDPEELNLSNGVKAVISSLGSCAYSVRQYIFSDANTARQLFLGNFESRMIIVDSKPNILDGFLKVPQGEEIDYFSFQAPGLQDLLSYSAIFTEQKIKPLKIMRLLPKVRTNMNPKQIMSFLQGQ